jgi:hypothetical protein
MDEPGLGMMARMAEQETSGRSGYIEVQKFRQPLLLLLLALVAAPFWYLAVTHFVFGAELEDAEALAVAWLVAGVLVPALLLRARLVTEVSPSGLRLRFPPVVTREIPFAEIRRAQARTYRPLREYGGWGLRWGGSGRWPTTSRGTKASRWSSPTGARSWSGHGGPTSWPRRSGRTSEADPRATRQPGEGGSGARARCGAPGWGSPSRGRPSGR